MQILSLLAEGEVVLREVVSVLDLQRDKWSVKYVSWLWGSQGINLLGIQCQTHEAGVQWSWDV